MLWDLNVKVRELSEKWEVEREVAREYGKEVEGWVALTEKLRDENEWLKEQRRRRERGEEEGEERRKREETRGRKREGRRERPFPSSTS